MANFNQSRGGGGRGFSRGGFKNRDSRGPTEMHKTICGKCGRDCEVPFRPTSGKPVFCSNCFESRTTERSSNFEDRQMFEAVCDECGNSCKVPFKPSGDKPIYCSNCFGEKKGAGTKELGPSQADYSEQFKALETKIDKILHLLDSTTTVSEVEIAPVKKRAPKKDK